MNIKNDTNSKVSVGDFLSWKGVATRLSWATRVKDAESISVDSYSLEFEMEGYKSAHCLLDTYLDKPPCSIIEYTKGGKNLFFDKESSDALEKELFIGAVCIFDKKLIYCGKKRFVNFVCENKQKTEDLILLKGFEDKDIDYLSSLIPDSDVFNLFELLNKAINLGGTVFIIPRTIEYAIAFSKQ